MHFNWMDSSFFLFGHLLINTTLTDLGCNLQRQHNMKLTSYRLLKSGEVIANVKVCKVYIGEIYDFNQ